MEQKRSFNLARLFAMFALGLLLIGCAPQSRLPARESGNGQFEIAVWSKGAWQAAGTLSFDQMFSQQQIDLASFADLAQIRITHKGTTAAHIDTVMLGGQVPTNTQGASEPSALLVKKLAQRDYDVIDASDKSFVFTFATKGSSSVLALVARIEPAQFVGAPFEFPTSNNYSEVDDASEFYAYRLNSVPGALNVNGDLNDEKLGVPFFKEWSQPASGHPADFTYGWVFNDANNLYVAIDFASDNTYDGNKDFTAVYVKTANGVQRFEVSVPEQQWGAPGFEYTERAVYQHKVYEYKIPLEQIGLGAARNDIVELAFEAYGTSTLMTLTSTPNPSTFGQNVAITANFGGPPGPTGFTANGIGIPGCGAVVPVGNTAVCNTSTLPVGINVIRVVGNDQPQLNHVVNAAPVIPVAPKEVPEGDTLLLLGGGMSGLGVWLSYQWNKRKKK